MANEMSDWLLYGGLLLANAAGGLAVISGQAAGALSALAQWAGVFQLAVAAGAGMKLAGK